MADIKIGQRLEERFDDVTAVKKGTSSNNSNPFKLTDLVLVEDTTESDKTLSSQVGLASDFMRDILAEIDLAFIGSGTAEDPYLVDTAKKLDMVRFDLSSYYKQTADISLGAFQSWMPLGSDRISFTGEYDGDGHTITDLVTSGYKNAGLFQSVGTGGVVKNLTIQNADINASATAGICGIVCAVLAGGLVDNCITSGKAGEILSDVSGGIVGSMIYASTISQCKSTATISASSSAGGVLGFGIVGSTISECIATGHIIGNGNNGGLVGTLSGASIENSYATGIVDEGTNSGGLVGDIAGDETESIINSYAKGSVNGSGVTHGGFIGLDEIGEELITISECYFDITTSGQATTPNIKAVGKITADMTTNAETTFAAWSTSIWSIANGVYPTLKWESA